jgi:hypothetical protein
MTPEPEVKIRHGQTSTGGRDLTLPKKAGDAQESGIRAAFLGKAGSGLWGSGLWALGSGLWTRLAGCLTSVHSSRPCRPSGRRSARRESSCRSCSFAPLASRSRSSASPVRRRPAQPCGCGVVPRATVRAHDETPATPRLSCGLIDRRKDRAAVGRRSSLPRSTSNKKIQGTI